MLRTVAIGRAIALVVLAATGGRVFFLPLLFIPLGLFAFGHRQNPRRRGWWQDENEISGSPESARSAFVHQAVRGYRDGAEIHAATPMPCPAPASTSPRWWTPQ